MASGAAGPHWFSSVAGRRSRTSAHSPELRNWRVAPPLHDTRVFGRPLPTGDRMPVSTATVPRFREVSA